MRHTADKMRDIIESLLLLAGIRQAEIIPEPLDMARIVTAAQERLAQMAAEYEAEIECPNEWPVALGYTPWIEEVWVNYLSNALKYGGQPPHVQLGATAQPDNMVQFWVQDNGPGLTAENKRSCLRLLPVLPSERWRDMVWACPLCKTLPRSWAAGPAW